MTTVCAIMAGLLPIIWSHGTGAEVMQRIAVPMIGGMVSSTLSTLIVIPSIYAVVKGIAIRSPRLAPTLQQRELLAAGRQNDRLWHLADMPNGRRAMSAFGIKADVAKEWRDVCC
jgi:hypothetical protein